MQPARRPLDRDRVVIEAVALADEAGLAALSMRTLAGRLGVEAMSLYHHVRGKEALLDAMVDGVVGELHLPVVGGDWRTELRERSVSGRAVLLRHPWAVGLMASRRTPGPQQASHQDAVLGCLAAQGFSPGISRSIAVRADVPGCAAIAGWPVRALVPGREATPTMPRDRPQIFPDRGRSRSASVRIGR